MAKAIVVDACAAIHGRDMLSCAGVTMLELIDLVFDSPNYLLSRAVQTECVRHRLADWLELLAQQQRLQIVPNDFRAARAKRQELKRRLGGRAPGDNDVGLLIIAQQHKAQLVTDDLALYEAAHLQRVQCHDLFDVCMLAEGHGSATRQDTANYFCHLESESPHYMPTGWKALVASGRVWPDDIEDLAARRRG